MAIQNRLVAFLKKQKKTIAIAESITGGYICYLLTKTPGASQIFKLGVVVYSSESKRTLFGFSLSRLTSNQGVSEHIARTLAKKVQQLARSDIGGAIVGFAGPEAPPQTKGLAYMALAANKKVYTKTVHFKGTRNRIRKDASRVCLEFILKKVAR